MLHRLAVGAACLFAACTFYAAERSRDDPNPISEALCGRPSGEGARARALDDAVVADVWRNANVKDLDAWLLPPRCVHGSIAEYVLFTRRRQALFFLHARVERATAITPLESALDDFPRWQKRDDDWPSAAECNGCDTLRRAAEAGVRAIARLPKRRGKADTIGSLLDGANTRESQLHELCAAMPAPGALDEMEERFRYYTWTARGMALVDVAKWFERADVVGECRSR